MNTSCALAFVIAGILAVGQAMADKPPWAAGGKGGTYERSDRYYDDDGESYDDDRSSRDRAGSTAIQPEHFDLRQRAIARDYFLEQYRRGRCPPGLAKKHNGCMPPGQAKKWSVGRPLPREVIYYELPSTLVLQFGRASTGYKYVRVASDILLIAVRTGIVIDAIEDLGMM